MSGVDASFQHLIDDFIDESLPLAEAAGELVLGLEACWQAPVLPAEQLARLKSHVHTVKGNAAMMGLGALADAAHQLEDVLALVSELSPPRPARPIELLVAGTDLLVQLVRAAATPASAPTAAPASTTAGAAAATVRVDFRRLDELLADVGEAAITHATLARHVRTLARRAAGAPELPELEHAALALERSLKAMRRCLLEVRLFPLSTLLARFPRHVRDLAHERDQPLRLTITGGDVPIDKGIIDRLGEPLVHLVRNAVAHGIEPPDERRRAGKPVEGHIAIDVRVDGGHVLIAVSDDGRGLDTEKILGRARSLGLADADAGADEARQLIFHSGLSTAAAVSTLAGRGVGLDAVGHALHALGGSIDVDSRPGRGCSFRLTVPVSMVLLRGLVCELAGELLIVPAAAVVEVLAMSPAACAELALRRAITWRNHLLGVLDGGALLGLSAPCAARKLCLVLATGARRRGLLVDRVLGQQEVVVQPLAASLGGPRHLAGATIMGSGVVAMILDAARVVEERAQPARAAEEPHRVQ